MPSDGNHLRRWGHHRRPGLGRLYPLDPWVDQLQRTGRPLPPGARLAALAGDSLWAVGICLAITLPLLLWPNGRLRSRRWRLSRAASVAGTTVEVVGWVLSPDPMTQTLVPVASRSRWAAGPARPSARISWVGWAVLFACIPVAVVCVVLRFRSSRDGFAARLRDQVDLDALRGEVLAVVDQTMQPARASLWLRRR